MKKLSALEAIDINGDLFSTGDIFNIDDGTAQELIDAGKAELVPAVVANDIQSPDGAIDREAFETAMDREQEATGQESRPAPKDREKREAKKPATPVTPPVTPPKFPEPVKPSKS